MTHQEGMKAFSIELKRRYQRGTIKISVNSRNSWMKNN